ncbi:MAG TPA: serine hydrolase [Nitriliruptorales bacterium]
MPRSALLHALESEFREIERTAQDERPWVDALVIVRDGELVGELYRGEATPERLYNVKSVTKSVVAMLYGIALDRGLIGELDTPIRAYLADYFEADGVDPRKGDIKLGDLLRMRSGLAWVENQMITVEWAMADDPVAFSLSDAQPLEAEPGERWRYSTADTQLLGACLATATGRTLTDLLREWLADPLGIEQFGWIPTYTQRAVFPPESAGAGLLLTARATAQLADVVRRRGEFDGQQLVSEGWVDRMLTRQPGVGPEQMFAPDAPEGRKVSDGYGLLWRCGDLGGHEAWVMEGYGGQLGVVVRDLGLTIAQHAHVVRDTDIEQRIAAAIENGDLDGSSIPQTPAGRQLAVDAHVSTLASAGDPRVGAIAGGWTMMRDVIIPAVERA